MRVGLFIPCYIDQLYPSVGLATVDVLEAYGVDVDFPEGQTCCGQPMLNTGCAPEAAVLARQFVDVFKKYRYVVAPSGSCVAMVTHHFSEILPASIELDHLKRQTFELSEFLINVLKIDPPQGRFAHRVGIHQSCHGLRELGLGDPSELMSESRNNARFLLGSLEGIQITEQKRPDECCGFGGTFAVAEEAVSCMMGQDRIADHLESGTEVMTAGDMSCLMHMQGLIRRDGTKMRVMHFAEILAEALKTSANG